MNEISLSLEESDMKHEERKWKWRQYQRKSWRASASKAESIEMKSHV